MVLRVSENNNYRITLTFTIFLMKASEFNDVEKVYVIIMLSSYLCSHLSFLRVRQIRNNKGV